MKEIISSNSKISILVDDEDYEWLNNFGCWWTCKKGYAQLRKNTKIIYMHRLIILKYHKEITNIIDHINRNPLDNRKCNLRFATKAENSYNRDNYMSATSIFKGVTFRKCDKLWEAKIRHNGSYYYLGRHKTERNAAIAYNIKAKELFGEFAKLNDVIASAEELIEINNKINHRTKCTERSSKFFGVSFGKNEKLWISRITHNKIVYKLGNFIDERSAAIAYNNKAIELLGDKAKLNLIS